MQQYFEDIELVSPGIYRNYRGHISGRTPLVYSLELLASGRMYLHQDSCPERVLDTPTLRWQTPGHTYSYGPVDEVGWEHYFITFQGPRAERLCQEGFARLAEESFIPIRRVDLFRGLFANIHRALVHEPKNNAQGVVYLEQILVYAAEEAAGGSPPSPYAAQLDALCADIQLAPERDICFRDVACELGLSYSHFRRCFRDHTGETPHRYALQAKLRAAADRIRHTDDPLKQIAADLNLGNPAQFSRTFRHHFDWPPGAWRRRAQV